MRKYYLFNLNNNINKDAKKIYLILSELFYLNSNKFKYGLTIFNEICFPFNKEEIIKKLKKNFECKNNKLKIEDLEKSIIEINNSCIIIQTNSNISIIFKYLNIIEKNIFVCDFINNDYFFLNDFVRLNLKVMI